MSGPERATVWVLAGAPGAGKSTVAELLLGRLYPVPAILDKDVLFAGFVGEVQASHGRPPGEREGLWYDVHVKAHEYGGMTAAAAQIRSAGCPVLLVGPFTAAIRSPQEWADWVNALGGEPVRLIWVGVEPGLLRDRIEQRGSAGDRGKLAEWERFVSRMQPAVPPPVPHVAIRNDGSPEDLQVQVQGLVAELGGE